MSFCCLPYLHPSSGAALSRKPSLYRNTNIWLRNQHLKLYLATFDAVAFIPEPEQRPVIAAAPVLDVIFEGGTVCNDFECIAPLHLERFDGHLDSRLRALQPLCIYYDYSHLSAPPSLTTVVPAASRLHSADNSPSTLRVL